MGDYYAIFFLIGAILFGGIAGYSILQTKRPTRARRKSKAGPLMNDKPENGKSSSAPKATAADKSADKLSKVATTKAASDTPNKNQYHEAPTVEEIVAEQDAAAINERESAYQESFSENSSSISVDSVQIEGSPKVDSASSVIVTDLVARMNNAEPIEQKELLALFRNHDFKFHRKVHIYGLNQLTDLWRDIEFELPSARFVELGVSIQLADRDGGMSKRELHDYQQMVLEFSNKFDAPFEFSMDIDDGLKQAQLLDQIGRRYDSMAVLNVVPKAKSGFRMADIESCARDLMMSADKNGIFMKTRGQKQNLTILYRLACTDGSGHFGLTGSAAAPIYDLVIYMNVPATEEPELVFQDMVKDANNLATWLDGKVVDRNGKVMTQRSYSLLMQQISDIAFSMQQDGLVAGDVVSKKLF